MKFWTSIVWPIAQAQHWNGKEIDKAIPNHPPQTPARHVCCVSEFNSDLIIMKRANIERWTPDGKELKWTFYSKLFYSTHCVYQYKDCLILIASGIDLILMIDQKGNIVWEWWGYKNGLCEEPTFINKPDWQIIQLSLEAPKVEKNLHLNSGYISGSDFIACSLKRKSLFRIPIGGQGYTIEAETTEGCHSPIPSGDGFIYGDKEGIMCGSKRLLKGFQWVKTIRETKSGFFFTHMAGVTKTDKNWNVIETISLPHPFTLSLLEE